MKTAQEMQAHKHEKVESDEGFRARLRADPKAAIREAFGVEISEKFTIHLHEDGPTASHLVIPAPTASLSDEELKIASGGVIAGDGYWMN